MLADDEPTTNTKTATIGPVHPLIQPLSQRSGRVALAGVLEAHAKALEEMFGELQSLGAEYPYSLPPRPTAAGEGESEPEYPEEVLRCWRLANRIREETDFLHALGIVIIALGVHRG